VSARIARAAPERAQVAAALAELVAALPAPLHPLAEGVLGLAPERGARGLLVAPGFDPRTRAAAGALPGIALARVLALEWDGETALVLEPLAAAQPGAAPAPAGPPPGASPETTPEPGLPGFRSGLRDDDLGLPRRPTRLAPRG